MSDPMTAVTGVTAVLGIVGKLAGIAKNVKGGEAKAELAEIQQRLLGLQQDFSLLVDENQRLKREAEERDRMADIEADLEFTTDGHFYVRKSEKEKGVIAYCPVCWGNEKKLVPLTRFRYPGSLQCVLHEKQYFWTQEYHEWQKKQAEQPRMVRSSWISAQDPWL